MATQVPPITFGASGVILPQEADILSGVQADINSAFGGGVNPSLSSPQGQLAQSLTAIIGDKNAQIANVSNQVNPDYADGRWQDAIGRIYFLDRIPASGTVVTATLTGAVGTVIPANATAQDANGYIYRATGSATIGSNGQATLQFQNQTTGAIPCPAGTLTKIYSAVIGWDAITNAADGTLGSDVESRAAFEDRRRASVAINAQGSNDAIRAAVLSVSGVLDAYVIDNPSGVSVNVGATNYAMLPHSIYIGVTGGNNADIANAILNKKNIGCDYNGNTTVTISDSVNYLPPYPTYTIKFNRPAAVPIKFLVQIQANSNLPVDIVTKTQAAIIAAFNGSDGGTKARIGSSIVSGRFYAGVAAISPYVNVLEILVGTVSPTLTGVTMGIDQQPTITSTDITVQIV